jgi:hypothetical protein
MTTNRLISETSPYLLQHAHNPVDWFPWGDEAFTRARLEDKPVLLSVGYAACHWCHVMERESFEDVATAALMNENFVCIKVDREERPDVDAIYMEAVQAISGNGGWPMTVFLAPEGEPFYAGTYFPPEDRHGMPSFTRVLVGIAEAWAGDRDSVIDQAGKVTRAIASGATGSDASNSELSSSILEVAYAGLKRAFDPEWGGFGGAPKFPQPMVIEFLLRCGLRGYDGAWDMAALTLDRMAAGGMYDQVGGGFHRYSVDRFWHVPHFEKMLYDNAQLARLYTHAWQATREDRYRRVAVETLDYLLREMRHDGGGFFASQDADSEGREGTFFVWTYDELLEAGDPVVAAYLGARPEGNWEGSNVLWTPSPLESVAENAGISPGDLRKRIEETRARLFERRDERERPATDDKILAGWNGLAISAFAEAGMVFDQPRYLRAAEDAADFVLTHLRSPQGRLLRAWRDDRAHIPAFLDDYAAVADGLLTLYEATFEPRWFDEARVLADDLLRLFADPSETGDGGGFFQTGDDAQALVFRPRDLYDNAVPSGNSTGAMVLLRLALLTGERTYERGAESALRMVSDRMMRYPSAFGQALSALDMHLSPALEIAIVGDAESGTTRSLIAEIWSRYLPNRVVAGMASDRGSGSGSGSASVPLLEGRTTIHGEPAAYVCEHFACRRPVTRPEELADMLG